MATFYSGRKAPDSQSPICFERTNRASIPPGSLQSTIRITLESPPGIGPCTLSGHCNSMIWSSTNALAVAKSRDTFLYSAVDLLIAQDNLYHPCQLDPLLDSFPSSPPVKKPYIQRCSGAGAGLGYPDQHRLTEPSR